MVETQIYHTLAVQHVRRITAFNPSCHSVCVVGPSAMGGKASVRRGDLIAFWRHKTLITIGEQ